MQRHMPIGYRMQDGKVYLEEMKAQIVRKVFSDYLSGMSAHAIAKVLTADGAMNANNKLSWNHCSVGKILENVKYLGDEMHPQMIETEIFERVQNYREEQRRKLGRVTRLNSMNTQNPFSGKLWCGECGEVFRKYAGNCRRPSEKRKWKCKNYVYKNRVHCICGGVTEEQIKEIFILAVNRIIKNPSLIEKKLKEPPRRFQPEFWKIDQRIKELEADEQYSSKELAILIFQRAELLYQTAQIHDYDHYTENMKQALSDKELQTEFHEELFVQIVKRMTIFADGRIDVEFINGLKIYETYKDVKKGDETYKN